ncbi:uncharacterized protein LOC111396017 isoform X2 [Olea europaea var. sylvestris]|uniref:uncharacterized protein LOC111396017 isoform X2 n=1 Tax=Olea europaea var. sylvestris TaxID=158386 RepID=UPI000C1CD175|nr:uncharacterized protein LOC111396017 isoform X2 [Olea europaea var. sylvestris]
MWVELICGLVLYRLFKRYLYEDDALLDLDTSHSNALFAVANRLEQLYYGSKAYVGLQIPDADSGSRQNIDIVLVTKGEALVISVMNVSGFISIDKNGNWVCTGGRSNKTTCLPDPTAETKRLVPILEAYLEQRGVVVPEGYLSSKVICPNPKFSTIQSVFPPEVITYDQWTQLKPEQKSMLSGWIKGAFCSAKKEMQESLNKKLCSSLSTAPMWDRLELKGNRFVLGEFMEFKGKQDDLQALINIRRSKVSRLIVQKISMFGFAHTRLQVLYSPRDYRNEGASSSSEWKEVAVRSSTEVVFHPQNCTKVRKYKLSSIISMSLSA